jgi:multiple sugar transport system permease protein
MIRRWALYGGLTMGALASLFPFVTMVLGSLQEKANGTLGGLAPSPGNTSSVNYVDINRAVPLAQALLNSGIFTAGVVASTLLVGMPAGYALARLRFPGRTAIQAGLVLVLILPFQVLMIPLYILVVRTYGLEDSFLGMIAPFAVNATAVFIFRQFFVSLPDELFDAAKMDGATELQILRRIALPLTSPAVVTAGVITFVGPWNEFLWPFLITKDRGMQPLAVSLGTYVSTNAATATNPYGVILAGACVLAIPVVLLFLCFQRQFTSASLDAGIKE